MDIMPDKKQLRAGSTALRETAREHTVLRIVEAVSNTEGKTR